MKFRAIAGTAALAVVLGFVAGVAFTDEAHDEMMKKLMEVHQPGPHQQQLAKMSGDWTVAGKFWHGPEPTESTATASTKMIHDRYAIQDYQGDFEGMPFKGLLVMGYDNWKKEAQSLWIDSFSTGLSYSSGPVSEDGKVTLHGSWHGPGGETPTRMEMTWTNENEYVLKSWMTTPEGEQQTMELVYTRK